jgi:RHS repeat-associated protein
LLDTHEVHAVGDQRSERGDYPTDGLGSTVALTGTTGSLQVEYSYGPYGSISITGATTSNIYNYMGCETEEFGIHYYRARYYNPSTGKFLSEDQLEFRAGMNLSAYTRKNPVAVGIRWQKQFDLSVARTFNIR